MRILVVSQYFWPENLRINDLVAGLVERGHQITVLTGIPNYPEGNFFSGYGLFQNLEQEYAGARVVRVPLVSRGKGGGIRLALNYASFVVSASICGLLRCRDKYDLIFIFEPSPVTVALPAILFKALRNVPIMFWVQDLWPESLAAAGAVTSTKTLKLVGKLVRFIYRRCDRILVTSKSFVSSVTQYVNDIGQIFHFPQYGEQHYRPVDLPENAEERMLLPKGFIVMFAGNIGAAQDFGTILSAAERLQEQKDIHFVVLGDGRAYEWVADEIARLQLNNFHLLGRFPLESMPAFFALADAMLVTLKKAQIFSLTVPAKIQSYLACGRPIIAALDGEGAKIIDEASAGLSCQTENPEELAALILRMRDMPEAVRRKMGESGLDYYRNNFDRTLLLDRLETWMKQLGGTRAGSV